MEQGNRLDSTSASASQHAHRNTAEEPALDAAVSRLLTQPEAPSDDELPQTALTATEECPAFQIGAQIGRLVAYHSDLDQPGKRDGGNERERQMRMTDDRIRLLQDAMSFASASSLQGALAQLIVGTEFVGQVVYSGELDSAQIESFIESARRCFYGVSGVLAASSGISARVFGSDYMMPVHLDHLRLAKAPVGWRRVDGPKPTIDAMVDPNGWQIERIANEYHANRLFYDRACDAVDAASEAGDDEARERAETCVAHAVRMLQHTLRILAGIPARTLGEFAHKARVIASECSDWWDDDDRGMGEIACRQMLDQLMTAGGLDRWDRRDFTREDLTESLLTPRPQRTTRSQPPVKN